jgi:hypothetical protein
MSDELLALIRTTLDRPGPISITFRKEGYLRYIEFEEEIGQGAPAVTRYAVDRHILTDDVIAATVVNAARDDHDRFHQSARRKDTA